ncbi:MAG: Asp-tRNA(Asn)/Glu-tRNA(Gln) amidotransferase subunit GatC [bacterium]
MTIERKDVVHVAKLARLELSDAEVERMTRQLDQILSYMRSLDALGALDPNEVPPTAHVLEVSCPERADVPRSSGQDEAILERAPSRRERFYSVPKVIE